MFSNVTSQDRVRRSEESETAWRGNNDVVGHRFCAILDTLAPQHDLSSSVHVDSRNSRGCLLRGIDSVNDTLAVRLGPPAYPRR